VKDITQELFAGHTFNGGRKWSVAIEMHENISAIERWRATLTDKQRRRLAGPLQNVRRWKRENGQCVPKPDALAKAEAAWRRFVSCVEALPPEQAAPLWCMSGLANHCHFTASITINIKMPNRRRRMGDPLDCSSVSALFLNL
jgi:hypothetical protein